MAGMFTITVQMPGLQAFRLGLQRFADQIDDWEPFWNDYFRDAWYRHVETHYATQGRSTGAEWPQLSESYGAWKQKHWPGLPIGVLSGATRESLTFPDDPNAVWNVSKNGLAVGTRVPWAIFLQYGTRARAGGTVAERHAQRKRATTNVGRGGMPSRPPLRVNQEFTNLTGRLMQQYAVKTLRSTGKG